MIALSLPLIGWGVAAATLDAYGHRPLEPEATWDAIIVPGCRVYRGGVPSPSLARRTRHAVRLWRAGKAPRLVFTGGVGRHPPSEARVARDLAVELGVPAAAITIEERSTSTEENARFAAELAEARRVLVVTDSYHVFRTRRVFARFFDEVGGAGSAPTPWPRATGALREVIAVAYYWVRGRI